MCMTAVYVMTAANVIGTVVSAKGAHDAGVAADNAHKANAELAEQNAAIALEQATYEANRQNSRVKNVIGSQRASFGASGVLSNNDILRQTAFEGELDRVAIMYAGTSEALDRTTRAAIERAQGKAARASGTAQAFGTLLTGAGDTYFGYQKASQYSTGKTLKIGD